MIISNYYYFIKLVFSRNFYWNLFFDLTVIKNSMRGLKRTIGIGLVSLSCGSATTFYIWLFLHCFLLIFEKNRRMHFEIAYLMVFYLSVVVFTCLPYTGCCDQGCRIQLIPLHNVISVLFRIFIFSVCFYL